MHNAPSVSYPVGRSRFSGTLLLLVWLGGMVACALWWHTSLLTSWRLASSGVGLLGTGLFALRRWVRSPAGLLAWDQEGWCWSEAGHSRGTVEVTLDLQSYMLLRW